MEPKFIVFDTETTGLFLFKDKDGVPVPADDPRQPRMASAAFILCDETGAALDRHKFFVRPDGWEMPAEAGAINGLTSEFLAETGAPVSDILDLWEAQIKDGMIAAAFNAQFDAKMMRAELRRAGRPDLFEETPNVCLMRSLSPYGPEGLPIMRGYVKLREACAWFGFVNENPHDAMGDAEAARQILARLIADGRLPEAKVHFAKVPPQRAEAGFTGASQLRP